LSTLRTWSRFSGLDVLRLEEAHRGVGELLAVEERSSTTSMASRVMWTAGAAGGLDGPLGILRGLLDRLVALEQGELGGPLGDLGVERGLLLGGELAELALVGLVQRADLGVERLDLARGSSGCQPWLSTPSRAQRALARSGWNGRAGSASRGSSSVVAARPSRKPLRLRSTRMECQPGRAPARRGPGGL
jgi:hypothetical protein